jgi:hypothetical protein
MFQDRSEPAGGKTPSYGPELLRCGAGEKASGPGTFRVASAGDTAEVLKLAELLGRRAARTRIRSMGEAAVLDRRALMLTALIASVLAVLVLQVF